MNLTTLAWKNLWRNRRRTLITAFSIAFGVLLAVTFTGMGDYTYTNMINAGASMGQGHITVEAPGYQTHPDLQKHLRNTSQLRQQILDVTGVDKALIRISGEAMLASARKSVAGFFIGIDPGQEDANTNLLVSAIKQGHLFGNRLGQGIVIGSRLAKHLHLELGNKLVYTTTDIHGEMVSAIARISGIFTTGVAAADSAAVLLPIDSLRKTLGYKTDEASYLAVLIRDQRDYLVLRKHLATLPDLQQLEVITWRQSQPDLAGMITIDKTSNHVSQLLVALLIAAGILNTLLMSVLERRREFGIMMAIGMSPLTLFRLVMTESFWLAVLGLLLGVLITAPWYYYMVNTGLDFSSAFGNDLSIGGVLLDPVMKIRLFPQSVIQILLGVFGLSLLSAIYPAWRAGTVPPVESLKLV